MRVRTSAPAALLPGRPLVPEVSDRERGAESENRVLRGTLAPPLPNEWQPPTGSTRRRLQGA